MFLMYLQHRGSQQSTDKAKNILFYALCVLYALTAATCIMAILKFFVELDTVSIDDHGCLTLFQLVVQNNETVYHIQIIRIVIFACSDFMAQLILVRTTGQSLSFTSFI